MSRDRRMADELIQDRMHGDDYQAAEPSYYNSRQHLLSDHRPVLAIYNVQVVNTDRKKKDLMREEMLKQLRETGDARVNAALVTRLNQTF